jgi:glycosyltransferase involved in cell wall biosynthesis
MEPMRTSEDPDVRLAPVNKSSIVVTVIITYYGKAETVLQCVDRLLSQSLLLCRSDEVEVIVVDDGTEGNEGVRHRLPGAVTYVWQRKMRNGLCRARNTGAKLANGQYLVFLDPDILVVDTYVDAVLRAFNRYGDRVVYCGYIADYHCSGSPDPRTEFGVWESPGILTQRFYQMAGGNMAISKALFSETPGFDEDLIYGRADDLLFGYHVSRRPRTAVCFDREIYGRHIPHPMLGQANVQASWEVIKFKFPEFYDLYYVRGLR